MKNKLVDLLATYGPSAASSSLFDEHVRAEVKKHGIKEFEIPAPKVDQIADLLQGEEPTNVILTGTAGDGKTYHIRQIFLKKLGGREEEWPGKPEDVIKTVKLDNGRELRIIRDLTEVAADKKKEEISHITRCLLGRDDNVQYLVAANDGQLLAMWRDAAEEEECQDYRLVLNILAQMMREETSRHPELRLHLYNLSRETSPTLVDKVIDEMLGHEEWEKGCKGCSAANDAENPCPILLNRAILMGDPADSRSRRFRERVKEVIDLSSTNDRHVPIRQVFSFVANVILGVKENTDHPLLDCNKARKIAKKNEYRLTNPYNNAVGWNLRDERRRNNAIFLAFETFSLGQETNNALDELILSGKQADEGDRYGNLIFEAYRNAYMRGTRDERDHRGFQEALEAQRRRLFFWMEPSVGSKPNELDPWALTVFHHAGIYLEYRKALAERTNSVLVSNVTRSLIKGLNRAFTGMMVEDADALWLAGSIGRTDDPAGRVSLLVPIYWNGENISVKVEYSPRKRRPYLTVTNVNSPQTNYPQLDLRLIIFEYLMRVAAGSLPASFSRQCHQEVRRFAMMLAKSLSQKNRISILSINESGYIQKQSIEVGSEHAG